MVEESNVEFDFRQPELMPMHCDNQFVIYIAQNHVFHERTKNIEVDCYRVRDAWTNDFSPVHIILKAVD